MNLAATAVRLGVAASNASTKDKEEAITTDYTNKFFDGTGTAVVDHLFSYTLDGNTVTLAYPEEINAARYMSSNWNNTTNTLVEDDRLNTSVTVSKNTATYNLNDGTTQIIANDKTVFFVKDKTSEYYVVTGLANLPGTTTNVTPNDTAGIPVKTTISDTISYQAPGSDEWIARAVFLETTNTFESVRDFVFVTDKYVTNNVSGSPVYNFTVVDKDGNESTMTTTQSANTLKNTVREWKHDGSYVEFFDGDPIPGGADDSANNRGTFTEHNVYVSKIEGNVVTLSNVKYGTIEGSFRVDGAAKVWDVQDGIEADKLQVNDMVGVYLDSDNIVTAAFIYGTMNGEFTPAPEASNILFNGVALSDAANVDVTAPEASKATIKVTVGTDVTIDSMTIGGVAVKNLTKSGNVYTGEWTVPAAGGLQAVKITVSQPGMDTLIKTYDFKFNLTVGAAEDPDAGLVMNDNASLTSVQTALNNGNNVTLDLISGTWTPATGALEIPNGRTLTVKGNLAATNVVISTVGTGKLVVSNEAGTATLTTGASQVVLVGNIEADALTLNANTTNVSGNVKVDGTLTVANTTSTTFSGTISAASISGAHPVIVSGGTTTIGTTTGGVFTGGAVAGALTVSGGTVKAGDVTGAVTVTGGTVTLGDLTASLNVKDATVTVGTVGSTLTLQAPTSGKTTIVTVDSVTGAITDAAGTSLTVKEAQTLAGATNVNGTMVFEGAVTTTGSNTLTVKAGGKLTLNGAVADADHVLSTATDTTGTVTFGAEPTAATTLANYQIDGSAATNKADLNGKTFTADNAGKWTCTTH